MIAKGLHYCYIIVPVVSSWKQKKIKYRKKERTKSKILRLRIEMLLLNFSNILMIFNGLMFFLMS